MGVVTGCLCSRPTSQCVAWLVTGCSRECPPARRSDLERRLPPPPTALPLFHSPCSAGVDPGLVDAPPHILCVAPVCARMVCGVGCVCGRTSPECAAAAQCPRVRAPSVMCQRLRQPRISSSLGSRLLRLSFLSLVADTARCTLSPPPPTPLAPPPPPHWWVCVQSRVWHAHVARRRLGSHATAWQLVVRGGGEALGAPHASFMMVPAAPRRIDARGSDRL